MQITSTVADIFGLSPSDRHIIRALSSHQLTIAELAAATAIPRTSLYYMLPYLKQRGFVEHIKLHKKIYWQKVPDSQIEETYTNALKEIGLAKDDVQNKVISPKASITFYKGNAQVIQVLQELADLPFRSRFMGIQPEASIINAINNNPLQKIVAFNEKIKESEIIAEGIIHETGTETMTKALSKESRDKLLKSFAGRSADTVKLPEGFLNHVQAEIYIFQNNVAIVNWQEEFAVIIRNKDVTELITGMFTSTKYLLERYDQNEKIAKKLIAAQK